MRRRNRILCAAAACAAAVLGGSLTSRGALVINEVYGGGGNTSAPYDRDFVELYNNGAASQSLNGLVLQYAAAGTAFSTSPTTNIVANLASVSLGPGEYYVVTTATGGAVGAPTPSNQQGSTGTNMSATAGKVRLTADVTTIDPTTFIDEIGYGSTASVFEGAGPAPGGSNTTSLQRNLLGADTNNNNADFTAAGPTPGAAVPEPAAVGLLGLGVIGTLVGRRRATRI